MSNIGYGYGNMFGGPGQVGQPYPVPNPSFGYATHPLQVYAQGQPPTGPYTSPGSLFIASGQPIGQLDSMNTRQMPPPSAPPVTFLTSQAQLLRQHQDQGQLMRGYMKTQEDLIAVYKKDMRRAVRKISALEKRVRALESQNQGVKEQVLKSEALGSELAIATSSGEASASVIEAKSDSVARYFS